MYEEKDIEENLLKITNDSTPSTVNELVNIANVELKIPKKIIVETILHLQEEGKLTLKQQEALNPSIIGGYPSFLGVTWFRIVITLLLLTVLSIIFIPESLYPYVYIRNILGIIFIAFLPGYCLVKVLFPMRNLDEIERIALSIGMSFALVPIVGIILNYTPFGITLVSITTSLLVLTIILSFLGVKRSIK